MKFLIGYINKIFLATILMVATFSVLPASAACGKIVIADMNWASATFMAHMDKMILESGLGCEVELVPGDTMPTGTSMAEKGEPDVAPELWVNALKEALDKSVSEGRLEYAGRSLLEGGEEGFWVPRYMVDKNPELATISGIKRNAKLFPNPEDKSQGLLMGCPAGWNCQITTGNLYNAFDLEEAGFVLGDPGSSAGLDGSLAKAYERGEPWFGYYWAPTAFLGKFDMVKVDFEVSHDKEEWDKCTTILDCPAPKPNAWSLSEVFTVTTTELKGKSPEAYAYLANRGFKNDFMNKFLKWMDDNQATGEEAAEHFLKNNEDIWSKWVSAKVATNIKAAL
ncbi:ABC transporter substrate-binding protein [Candidatus Persebacteraceae bacterium Df01]|jgi:glycine betaine/proline transport system substrate-binding protein|uniref:ABC transporter substrate-binding protein n=1 Tax=Candidatus Doriopsillibacter californiensis TaxID=2970740 RepID=A0ABT7QND9_9GAMM|nr:ABC transporter substrate-binding protein [Candidatus Persebacteraceae bacterium Df01]